MSYSLENTVITNGECAFGACPEPGVSNLQPTIFSQRSF